MVATLPPIEQISYDEGSGGYQRPCSAAAALTSAFSAPGSTTAMRVAGSTSIARMRSSETTRQPSSADAPPDSPVPAPRGHDGETVLGGEAYGGLHVLGARRAYDREGDPGGRVVGAVPAIAVHPVGVDQQHAVGQLAGERVEIGRHGAGQSSARVSAESESSLGASTETESSMRSLR